ncbi:uncharacterized protein LOC132641152 isoform X1 [Lycium barbarum]|uniref:uncharacterized protein LOC132641152 isoform X1 n=1 Tax=Lycium barbarum TaxID=112863 RepID=UPI00293E1BD7|nr:uncharacterized protein LOC132641152 isoform X1 [Lycium barbarum]
MVEGMAFLSHEGVLDRETPLSPSLFILTAELLSQMLNALHLNRGFKGFYMKDQGPKINHLAFADDTIIFTSGHKKSLKLILGTLEAYEKVSGQLINRDKSCFTMAPNTTPSTIRRIERILGMRYDKLPMKYLGCPLYTGRKLIAYFSDMVNKIINRVKGWHLKFLSFGGRAVLIRHVLMALNTHTFAATHPPKAGA